MTKVTLIGAGSAVFTRQLIADLLSFTELADIEISLQDVDGARLAVAAATARQVNERFGTRATITAGFDRKAALVGSDFVINMIQVGGIEATRKDLLIPAAYGLNQVIGDTTGVGGVFRALRTFPVLTSILADIRDVCPDAYFLNYTNPMAMNVGWAAAVAPEIKTVGLCHSISKTVQSMSALVGVPFEETHYRAAGVNHQAWILEWSRNGEDLYQLLRARIAADPELERRVRVEIFRRIGYYPTESSEHSAEYLSWFLRSPDQIDRYRLTPLAYIGISETNVDTFAAAQQALATGAPLELERGAIEYAPQIIHSIVTGESRVIHANVVNAGLIDNLPSGAVIEVPCTVDAAGVTPHAMGSLPAQCAALNRPYLSVAELTIEAALTGNPRMVRQAVLMDPNASSILRPDQIWDMCNALVRAHGNLLDETLRVDVAAEAL
ncbi:alpha-galactosidase [Cryobacterium sp. TMT1-66-1]|uniref:alpha-galactosidase n=1 Tax=Cryobacterium sp. TMT1-66-1 TaxID=1259242 RepID=UPI00106BC1DA|nr:alpha-galactosidase [Cryobacterium sp. TMT1-66-1]TFD08221.1 alpha-galactosidase [Cryobacterium sp. TMT1-66-1]